MKTEDIKRIQHSFNMFKELHGDSVPEDQLYFIVASETSFPIEDVKKAIETGENIKPQEYGIVIGRFQPFHFGHQHIINEIILDGRKPIVILGDDNGKDKKKNPLSFEQRKILIEQVFPGECYIIQQFDNEDWNIWFNEVVEKVSKISDPKYSYLYYHNKECDRYDYFECNGKEYFNEFYTAVYKDAGINLREVEFVKRSDIHIDADARNIRDDFEDFKHLLDGRNYWQLKKWGW